MANADHQYVIGRYEGEMLSLDDGGACLYYLNYLNDFLPSQPMTASFLNRMGQLKPGAMTETARSLTAHAARWYSLLNPFEAPPGGAAAYPEAAMAAEVCRGTNAQPDMLEQMLTAHYSVQADELRELAMNLLRHHPMYVLVAEILLSLDAFQERLPGEWLPLFKCPKVLAPLWKLLLFRHSASLGAFESALELWEEGYAKRDDPFTLTLAAEMFCRTGDMQRGMTLYERSLALDPLQGPARFRLAELRHPFRPDHSLVHSKKTCVYLYCYNKAAVLAETLESLAKSDIGPARIKVLLNGCTDDSATSARKALELFPDNDVEIITLPVNIGAPAARNWLISQPATWESDYVAFLDDDVEVQKDWLAHFLTLAESDSRIANVGCKVVFPGRYPLIQYLYRHISVANKDMVRVSPPVPDVMHDTGLFTFNKLTRVVMGCQHLMRVSALKEVPWFDIRYSPSQVDDTDHDLQFCLKGYQVAYCGTVTCTHKHSSGVSMRSEFSYERAGNVSGNDVKFFYKFLNKADEVAKLDSLSLNP